ncbi:MAG: hypothetical protein EBZ52_04695, partial [Actinobacteria bacterium]|nr:hypothetical protein [Actinomycetota bacterium]
MAGERTFLVRILGNADSAITAFKKLGKEGSDALGEVFDVAKKGALIATAAAGAIAGAAFSAVKAATEDQESQKLLADQLRRTMQATDEQIASVEEYISKQQMLVGVADDQLRPALSNLARATGDLNFAQKNLNLALDISAATGIELETVSLALGKAFTGNIGALTKLGVPIDENVKKSKDLASVVETLNQQFGGAASDAANTFSGRLKILKLSIGEAWEGIGYALLPIAEKLVAFIQKNVVPVIQAFADELSGGGSLRDALVAAAAQAGDFGMKIIDMVETVVNVVGYIGNVFIDIAKPIILAGGAIGSLIALVKDGKDGFDKVGIATQNFVAVLDGLKINSAVTGAAFDSFRNSVLGVAAAANLTQDELRTLDQVQRGIAAGGPVQKFIGPLLEGYGSLAPKTKTAAQLQAEFNKKLSELSGAGGGGGAAKKATSAIDNAKKALETYTSALNKVTSSQKAFESAQKATAAAKKQLGKRDEDLATAQERFNVRKDPESNPQMIREAEINLAQAKLAVKDAIDAQNEATDSQTESQSKLNEVVNGAIVGSVVYESLLKELNDAKDAQAEASDNVAEAVKREAEAYKDLADAIRTAALAAGASGQTFTAPTLPTVPTPTNTGTTLTGGRTEQGTPTIVINTGIGTNGVEAGRQIVGVLQEYT